MNLNQHREADGRGNFLQIGQILIRQDGGDEQRGIRPCGTGLVQLMRTEDEILAEQRQLHSLTNSHEHIEAALKKSLVSQHREATGASEGVGTSDRHRIEVLADHPFAWAGFFHLGDHRRHGGC